MKKLIFIDNDHMARSIEDVGNVKNMLRLWCKLPQSYIDTIEIISDFHLLDKEQVQKIMFNDSHCICTWSMYTPNHYGSLYQMTKFLTTAGKSDLKNIVYIDASSQLEKALCRELSSDNKIDALAILSAIETNYIISFDEDNCFRLRVDLKGYYESIFKHEKINLLEILK